MPTPSHSPFRGENYQFFTRQLFIEMQIGLPVEERVGEPPFSLYGREGYIDCRKTFVEERDITGYKWAMKYLHSWEHWERLQKCKWFVVEVQRWQEELRVLLRQEALAKIQEIAASGSPQAYQAAKFLANQEWDKPTRNRGRPSKEELKGELRDAARALSREEEDAERIGLTVINGGK